jgi:2'-5' RNA ligase
MLEKNANQFEHIYAELGINLAKLGCIMLNLDGTGIPNLISEQDLYFTDNADRYWIKGFVAGHTPHVTLLYGLLESGKTIYKKYVDEILQEWNCNSVEIDHVGFFKSPYGESDPYYCIVAHLKISDELKEANSLLQLLPHINTFPSYKAHITIAYIKQDETLRDKIIEDYNKELSGKKLSVSSINYGK